MIISIAWERVEAREKIPSSNRLSIPHLGLQKKTVRRLERLGWLLNRYPNLYTDISFGFHTFHKEGFEALAKWRTRSKKFLTDHALKTFYASDMVLEASKDNEYIDNTLRSYMQLLEMKAFRFFLVPHAPMHGLELDLDTLRKIYAEAPIRFLNEKNRKLPDLSKIRKTGELIEGLPPSTKMPRPIAYDPAPPEK